MNYSEAIDWLFGTQMFGVKLGLERPRWLLKEFQAHPAHGVRVVHVAGTNGKGSTCAMVDSVARACGMRTGLFTSPHLVDFRERIKVSGEEIGEEDCARLLTGLREVCEGLDPHPTFFEIALVAAMRWFRERECELIVLETGMGGRLDATTAVPADVCAVTPVALDHMEWLGNTLGEIAREKAGIFLEGKPAVSAPQVDEVRRVLEKEANERRTPLGFVAEALRGYPIGLAGEHQAWNAALALECLHLLGLRLDSETVRYGLASVKWPGRFEEIERDGLTVVLDGAHNPAGAAVVAAAWRARFGERKCSLVFSAVAAKDAGGIASELEPLAERVHVCAVDTPRAMAAEELAACFGSRVAVHPTVAAALEAALAEGRPVLVAGSLFLVGEVKALFEVRERLSTDQ